MATQIVDGALVDMTAQELHAIEASQGLPAPSVPPAKVSKLLLRRALRARQLEAAYDTWRDGLPATAAADMAEAVELHTDDADTWALIESCRTTLQLSEAERDEVLREAAA